MEPWPLEAGAAVVDIRESQSQSRPSLSRSSTALLSSVPIGLSGKELARLRAEALVLQHTDAPSESSGSEPEPDTVPVVTVEPSVAISESEGQGLRSVVESLRREVQQLRIERLDAPPSYAEDNS